MWIRITRVDTGVLVHHFTLHHSFVDGSTPVTEIHSFATISDNSFAVGYHNGDIGPRELGILYFSDAFGSPGSFVRRRIPAEYEANASEPCVKYYDGILYLPK